jgi:tetratricopeptide (TPR) repeat protein
MRLRAVVWTLLVAAPFVSGAAEPALATSVEAALRSYDLTAATVALAGVRDARASDQNSDLERLHAVAALGVAELLRIEFEGLPSGQADDRRELGGRIDATAREGLRVVDRLPESSERERMRADLIATMIRSDFRAKKHEHEFNNAVSRALELDEDNPSAWVSAAKPFLFAPPQRGKDLEQALRHLDRALELDPTLESALLLRAVAHRESGDQDAARADWRAALDRNPRCLPAAEALREP